MSGEASRTRAIISMPVIPGIRWSETTRATGAVAQDELGEHLEGLGAGGGAHDPVVLAVAAAQVPHDGADDLRVVVDGEDGGAGHGVTLGAGSRAGEGDREGGTPRAGRPVRRTMAAARRCTVDETFAAYLSGCAHRAELGESMAALDAALALPVGLGAAGGAGCGPRSPSWPTTCATTSSSPRGRAGSTRTSGLGAAAPREVDQQLADHEVVLAEVERLLGERDEGLPTAEAVAAHREAATALVGVLVRHRQRGSDLVWEAYDLDLGGSG